MAFEYFVAYYLLNRQSGRAILSIGHLKDLDYPEIPWHYQEAILLHEHMTQKKVDLHDREIAPQIRRRFEEFLQRWQFF